MKVKERNRIVARRVAYSWYLHSRNLWDTGYSVTKTAAFAVVLHLFVGLSGVLLGTEVLFWTTLIPTAALILLAARCVLKFRRALKMYEWSEENYWGHWK